MSKNFCIYHYPCMDGMSSAYVFSKWAKEQGLEDFELVPCSYEGGVDFEKFRGGTVYFIDFSLKREAMLKFATVAKKIIVIDHHKTAQENLVDLPANVEVNFDMNKCGATLAWQYFFPDKKTPKFLEYIQDNDIWTRKLLNIEGFVAWLDLENPSTIDAIYGMLVFFEENSKECFEAGNLVLAYKKAMISDIIDFAYKTTLCGVEVMKINCPMAKINSELGNELVKKHNLPAWVWHEAKTKDGDVVQKNSLRSADHLLDVSALAKRLLGGGHRNAAGFVGVGKP